MRTFVVFLGLTTLLGSSFPLHDFQQFLPAEMFVYPRKSITNAQFTAIVAVIHWVLPALAVAAFMWRANVTTRLQSGAGTKWLTIAVLVFLGQWAMRLLAGFVPGGGGLYTMNTLLAYVALPLKLMLVVGAVQMLTSLKPQHVA